MRAVNGLRFHGRVPPRIVEHHVAGCRQIQAGARILRLAGLHGGILTSAGLAGLLDRD
jgi:hypothetical protein